MLRNYAQYTAKELRDALGAYATHTQKGNAIFVRPSRAAGWVDGAEDADLLLWDCGCRAVRVGAGRDGTAYYDLRGCPQHALIAPSVSMPARLLADMFAMSNSERTALLDAADPNIAWLFDVAASNIDPSALATIVRDSALTSGGPTVLEELMEAGAVAALHRLRLAYDNIPAANRVSSRWSEPPR